MAEHSFMDEYVREPAPPPRGYSLAALFLLVTTAGIIFALFRSATEHVSQWRFNGEIAVHSIVGVFVGAAIGSITAQAYPRRLSSQLLGVAVGGLVGGICAAVAAAGASSWLYLVGALALIGMGVLARFGQRRRGR